MEGAPKPEKIPEKELVEISREEWYKFRDMGPYDPKLIQWLKEKGITFKEESFELGDPEDLL